jgi:ribosomal protein S18 acetylase RimI-like enzyme
LQLYSCGNGGAIISISSVENATRAASGGGAEIRPCQRGDIARIAEIHRSQFVAQGSLLSHVSPKLIATLYEEFLGRSIFLVHASDGVVDGFVLGGPAETMLRCRLSFLRKRILLCVADFARHPHLWFRALRSFGKLLGKWFSSKIVASPADEFRIVSIAVASGATRKGVGTALVGDFEKAIRGQCSGYCLSVLKTNTSAIRFYERLQFRCAGETAIAWTMRKELG